MRSINFIVLAYVAAPLPAVTLLWCVLVADSVLLGHQKFGDSFTVVLPLMLLGGGIVGLAVEAVFVTPVLVAFHRYRWQWLNAFWFVCGGLAVGELAGQLLGILTGPHHWFGWRAVMQGILVDGFVGVTAALVFQAVAFRWRVEVSQGGE